MGCFKSPPIIFTTLDAYEVLIENGYRYKKRIEVRIRVHNFDEFTGVEKTEELAYLKAVEKFRTRMALFFRILSIYLRVGKFPFLSFFLLQFLIVYFLK